MTEQRFPEDFDYDDITIGQTLLNACRGRADHSEEKGLSFCLSSSSMSHDRTGKPVVCRDASHTQGHEILRQKNSECEQIWTLLDRQREQILANCQAEIRKHEFQADYDLRSIQQLNETIESQQEELHRAQAEERRRQDHQLLHEQLLEQNWDLREAHEKSLNQMEELKRFQGSTFVKGMNPAPHIHEHLQYTIMATSMRTPSRITTSRFEHTAMNNTNTTKHTDANNTQF